MEFLEPWHSILNVSTRVAALNQELQRELAEGHPLYGLAVRATARRQDCDDVLYSIEDGSGRFAVVHLTWARTAPERLPWPGTSLYASFDAWQVEGMRPDCDEFQRDDEGKGT